MRPRAGRNPRSAGDSWALRLHSSLTRGTAFAILRRIRRRLIRRRAPDGGMKAVGNGMRRLFIPLAAVLIAAALSARASAGSLTAEDKRLTKAAFAAIEQEHWAQAKDIIARAKNPLARKLIDWLDLRQAGPGRAFADYV